MKTESEVQALSYSCQWIDWEFRIEPSVVSHLMGNRQLGPKAPEVGGQLFAVFEKYLVRVVRATGPRCADKKARFWFLPDRRRENAEIKECFSQGLHYIGDWHTHPERCPTPSEIDLASMKACFEQSKHELKYFVLVIAGQASFPECFWVSLHDRHSHQKMTLTSPNSST